MFRYKKCLPVTSNNLNLNFIFHPDRGSADKSYILLKKIIWERILIDNKIHMKFVVFALQIFPEKSLSIHFYVDRKLKSTKRAYTREKLRFIQIFDGHELFCTDTFIRTMNTLKNSIF